MRNAPRKKRGYIVIPAGLEPREVLNVDRLDMSTKRRGTEAGSAPTGAPRESSS